MGRGLRHGDPMSPFLFVLEVEVLNKMLLKVIELDMFRGLQVGSMCAFTLVIYNLLMILSSSIKQMKSCYKTSIEYSYGSNHFQVWQ